MRAFWHDTKNFGDTLTVPILEHFLGEPVEFAGREEKGKIIACGSIVQAVRENDVVWGAGTHVAKTVKQPAGSKFLAVRGPITRVMIEGDVPKIYGDPGMLLPMFFRPTVAIKHSVGVIPHYIDQKFYKEGEGEHFIDVLKSWREVVEDILSCSRIKSSSLHGVIAAEAYGIPAAWITYGDRVIGAEMKFNDYYLGTGRDWRVPCRPCDQTVYVEPIQGIEERQKRMVDALVAWEK